MHNHTDHKQQAYFRWSLLFTSYSTYCLNYTTISFFCLFFLSHNENHSICIQMQIAILWKKFIDVKSKLIKLEWYFHEWPKSNRFITFDDLIRYDIDFMYIDFIFTITDSKAYAYAKALMECLFINNCDHNIRVMFDKYQVLWLKLHDSIVLKIVQSEKKQRWNQFKLIPSDILCVYSLNTPYQC